MNMILVYGASSSSVYTNVRAKADYMSYTDSSSNPEVVVVGGFRERQEGTGTRKVFIHVRENTVIHSSDSDKGKRTKCSLRTGDQWSTGTHLELNIAGTIIGAGGDGGKGGDDSRGQTEVNGKPGQSGTSALGIEDEVQRIVVQSTGSIVAGAGGGGGGGGFKMMSIAPVVERAVESLLVMVQRKEMEMEVLMVEMDPQPRVEMVEVEIKKHQMVEVLPLVVAAVVDLMERV